MDKRKYYVWTVNLNGELSVYENDVTYYADDDWKEATEGIFTNGVVTRKWKDADGNIFAKCKGTMVKTAEFDFDSPLSKEIKDVLVIGGSTLVLFQEDDPYVINPNYKARLEDGTLIPVVIDVCRRFPGDMEQRIQRFKEMARYMRKEYGEIDYEHFREICINNFAERTIDCAAEVKLLYDCLVYIFYPGYYRDGCAAFYVKPDGTTVNTEYGDILERYEKKEVCKLTLPQIQEEMAKYGISAGEDSGDIVEGITPEERKLLTTHRLANGTVIVQLKAKTFSYELLKNKNLISKVDKGLGKWLYRLGEPNDYISWID